MKRRKWRRMPKWLGAIFLTALIIVFVLLSPILLPLALLMHTIEVHRLRRTAKAFFCLSCGEPLGIEALKLADAETHQKAEERRRKNPGVRYRILRTLHAICPHCGTRYTYRKKERTFILESSALDSELG